MIPIAHIIGTHESDSGSILKNINYRASSGSGSKNQIQSQFSFS
jgi:hypothetical protein